MGWQISTVPQPQKLDAKAITYVLETKNDKGTLHLNRVLNVDVMFLPSNNYATLRKIFQTVRTGDEQQVILQPGATTAEQLIGTEPASCCAQSWACSQPLAALTQAMLRSGCMPWHRPRYPLTMKRRTQFCSTPNKLSTCNRSTRSRPTFGWSTKYSGPSGREYGIAAVSFNPHRKITGLHGWCIPAQGKDYEVKDKEAVEIALPKIAGSELISDVKDKLLRIPARRSRQHCGL